MIFVRYRFILLFCLLFGLLTPAQAAVPKFSDYPVPTRYRGIHATPQLKTTDDQMYRTRIREISQSKVNLAGKYTIGLWGCGTGCGMGVAVDVKTGKVYWIPFLINAVGDVFDHYEGDMVESHGNSKLVVFAGVRTSIGGDEAKDEAAYARDNGKLHYYRLDDQGFHYIGSYPPATNAK